MCRPLRHRAFNPRLNLCFFMDACASRKCSPVYPPHRFDRAVITKTNIPSCVLEISRERMGCLDLVAADGALNQLRVQVISCCSRRASKRAARFRVRRSLIENSLVAPERWLSWSARSRNRKARIHLGQCNGRLRFNLRRRQSAHQVARRAPSRSSRVSRRNQFLGVVPVVAPSNRVANE